MVGGDDAVARCPFNRNPRAPNPPANTLCDLFPRLIADLHSNSTAAGSGSTWLATGGNTIAESNMGCTGHFFSIRTEGYVPDARHCPPRVANVKEYRCANAQAYEYTFLRVYDGSARPFAPKPPGPNPNIIRPTLKLS